MSYLSHLASRGLAPATIRPGLEPQFAPATFPPVLEPHLASAPPTVAPGEPIPSDRRPSAAVQHPDAIGQEPRDAEPVPPQAPAAEARQSERTAVGPSVLPREVVVVDEIQVQAHKTVVAARTSVGPNTVVGPRPPAQPLAGQVLVRRPQVERLRRAEEARRPDRRTETEEKSVRIHIGRIDVRVLSVPTPAAPPTLPHKPASSGTSLEEYLRRSTRSGGTDR